MIINNGVYTNNSLTLVDFDLGQIYNSQKFTETSKLFAVLPLGVWLLDFLQDPHLWLLQKDRKPSVVSKVVC